MSTSHALLDSPLGPLVVVASDGQLRGLYFHDQRHLPSPEHLGPRGADVLPALCEQLGGYFAGELTTFDVPLPATGTPFQRDVWAALRDVPYGSTCSYAELARAVGRPAAVRAVGAANGRNPVCIVVPCHRVVGSSGSLTGYAGGLSRKRRLLAHERRVREQPPSG